MHRLHEREHHQKNAGPLPEQCGDAPEHHTQVGERLVRVRPSFTEYVKEDEFLNDLCRTFEATLPDRRASEFLRDRTTLTLNTKLRTIKRDSGEEEDQQLK